MEPYTVNSTAGNSAPIGGRRRKLKLVTKKAARKALKKMGMKIRGGAETDAVAVAPEVAKVAGGADAAEAVAPVTAGRRRRHTKKTRRGRRKSLFGLKY